MLTQVKQWRVLLIQEQCFPFFLLKLKGQDQMDGAGDLVQHSRTMRIPLKLSFRGLCGEYSVKPLNQKLLYISGKVKKNMDSRRLTMESPEPRSFFFVRMFGNEN